MSIVIAEVVLNVNKRLPYSLTGVRGIGLSRAKAICKALNFDEMKFLRDLDDAELRALSEYINENYSEEIGSNLRRNEQKRIQELMSLGSYIGLRHRKRLPVRGQRTSSNAKTRRGKAGSKVQKKK